MEDLSVPTDVLPETIVLPEEEARLLRLLVAELRAQQRLQAEAQFRARESARDDERATGALNCLKRMLNERLDALMVSSKIPKEMTYNLDEKTGTLRRTT